jgi:glucose/arabinose dehydrogenase
VPPPGESAAATLRARDAARLRVDAVIQSADAVIDLAFAPDGRLFLARRSGRIDIARGGRVGAEPAIAMERALGSGGRLLALALDPQFARTHFVYVLYTAAPGDTAARGPADTRFVVARLREAADTLGDKIVLLDGGAAAPSPAGSLRFGPDGRLYVALDDGGDAKRGGDPASLNGKVLRLNPDGTTPPDQARGTPVYAAGLRTPTGLAWDPGGRLWIVDRRSAGAAQLRVVDANGSTAYALPPGAAPTGIVVSRDAGDLVVGSEAGGLLQVRLDRQSGKPGSAEPLLQDGAGAVHALTVAPDGAIVFATANAVARLGPSGAAR